MVKLAWRAQSQLDNLEAFDLLRLSRAPSTVLCMGAAGLMSRVLAGNSPRLDVLRSGRPIGHRAGAPSLSDMMHTYRFDAIDHQTKLLGVIGQPVAHTLSPFLFNACFREDNLNAVYLPLEVQSQGDQLQQFLEEVTLRPWMDAVGFSVTIPHKQAAAAWVGKRIEPLAAHIGAVNTLAWQDNGFFGFNTDYAGALDAICEGLGCERSGLAGMRVHVLGAGV